MQLNNFKDQLTLQGQVVNTGGMFTGSEEILVQLSVPVASGASGDGNANAVYAGIRTLAGGSKTATITGTPTGGTFTLTVTTPGYVIGTQTVGASIQTTTAIAYNASAATVQTALQALTNVGSGNATVTGSVGGPYTVSFAAAIGKAVLTASGALLTGGTSPGVTIAPGNIADPTVAPTAGTDVSTGGSLAQSTTYYFKYTYKNANGETLPSPEGSHATPASGTATNTFVLTAAALPSGATGTNWYLGTAAGQESFVGTSASNTYTATATATAGALPAPAWNTTYVVTETLNLTDGSLKDPFGAGLVFKSVANIHLQNPSVSNPVALHGGGTYAHLQTSASNKRWISPAYLDGSGQTRNGYTQSPAYGIGGVQVVAGVNNTLQVSSHDPDGISYGLFMIGQQ